MSKRKVNETVRDNFAHVVSWAKERGINQTEFAERISKHIEGESVKQQYISAYTRGREIPDYVLDAVEVEFGFMKGWILGVPGVPMTDVEDAARRHAEWAELEDKTKVLFGLLAEMAGWHREEFPEGTIHAGLSIPATAGIDPEYIRDEKMKNFTRIGKESRVVTISEVEYELLMERMLAHFDFEMEHTRFKSESQQALKEHGLEDR